MTATCHYFVDEAGDGTIFNRHGKLLVGTEGCSTVFAVGAVKVADPASLAADLEGLRGRLASDPYFAGVPSFDPAARKTALAFHAKDDLPEVRREVFRLLVGHQIEFVAVARDKYQAHQIISAHGAKYSDYRYHPNSLYDDLVRRLFAGRLHLQPRNHVCFAVRGSSNRTEAFEAAIKRGSLQYQRKRGIVANSHTNVRPARASEEPCLQAVDYCLWALQRFLERREGRYLKSIWSICSEIVDLDGIVATWNQDLFATSVVLQEADIETPEI